MPAGDRARSHPEGIVDLSVGTPVDPTPLIVREALAAAADAPGYPFTAGTQGLRTSIAECMARRHDVQLDPEAVLPTIGSKELVAWLPTLLGLGSGDVVAVPGLAYPTYEVGALLAGCQVVRADSADDMAQIRPALIWLNSPANPSGRVLTVDEMASIVEWGRANAALVVSDECYIDLAWTASPVSLLHSSVSGGSDEGLLAVHSLSKRSNFAGYRFGFTAGDADLVARLLEVRKHVGMIVPSPVQAAAIAALDDDAHVAEQVEVYRRRRDLLLPAIERAGFQIEHSQAGLYLWCTRGDSCWQTVDELAEIGILVAPGDFYGEAGARHVRFALTATDERVEAAVTRLTVLAPSGR